jgi:uncharacterized protein
MGRGSVLVVPGWNGSEPGHWQSFWERKHPEYRRVEQQDWSNPRRDEWVRTLDEYIGSSPDPVVLVAHSLGCLTVAEWAASSESGKKIEYAFLVAPPDLDSACPDALRSFAPVRRARLPFRSTLVGSENDPYMTLAAAQTLASDWGSQFVNAGRAGHINVTSGFGDWPEGERLFAEALTTAAASVAHQSALTPLYASAQSNT